MRLIILRHAHAEEGVPDDERPLSEKGQRRAREVAKALEKLDWKVDEILHSPKRRAVETAKLLESIAKGKLSESKLLARAPGQELLDALTGQRMALVGHAPYVSMLTAWLVAGRAEPSQGFEFSPAGAALLEGLPQPGAMTLVAFLPSKFASSLA